MKKLLFSTVITMIAVSPALGRGMDDGGETCKACPSWRSLLPPRLQWWGRQIFPKTEPRFAIWSNNGSERTTVTWATRPVKSAGDGQVARGAPCSRGP